MVLPEQAAAGETPPLDDKPPLVDVAAKDDGLFRRDTLLGDWGGLRPALGERGITWELSYTAIYAGVFDGDARDKNFDWGHRTDAFIRADTGKLGLWEGGGLQVHLESRHGESARRSFPRSGGLWPPKTGVVFPLGDPDELVATLLPRSITPIRSGTRDRC